ncbi:MAG TPA: hypothetical protein VF980_18430 [Thermoanaerobaculia bacterium]
MQLFLGALLLVALVIAFLAIVAFGIAAMKRSARDSPGSGALGNAMQELESLFVESKKHVIEAEHDAHADEDASGDPPEK